MAKNPYYDVESALQNLYPDGMGSFKGSGGGGGFEPTPTQLEAINSGANATKINQIATNTNNIATNTNNIANKLDKLTDTGEFVYTHDGGVQTSKGFIAGDTLLNSSAHVPSAHTVKKYVDDLVGAIINDTLESATTTWSSNEIKARFEALSGKATIIVVATLPGTLQDNTLYYVGTSSPYHIWLRSGGITYDMGTTEIDLSSYYTKTQTDALLDNKQDKTDSNLTTSVKTIVGGINEINANKQDMTDTNLATTNKTVVGAINEIETDINALPNNYAPFNSNAYNLVGASPSADDVLWDFVSNSSPRREQTKKAYAYITDPITNSNIYGTVKTTILYSANTLCTIEQVFTELNPNNTVRFRRLGTAPAQTLTFTTATITWKSWYPVEYPKTTLTISSPWIGGVGSCYYVSGGVLFIRLNGIRRNSQGTVSADIVANLPSAINQNVVKNNGNHSVINSTDLASLFCQFFAGASGNQIEVYGTTQNTDYFGNITVALGY